MATINKLATGIDGLDSITRGGLPEGRCTLLLGGPGCGKTVLALQTLTHAARTRGEPGIFVAFEESSEAIIANAHSFGWGIPDLIQRDLLLITTHQPAESTLCGTPDVPGILAGLSTSAKAMGARWIVFDAIDVLLSLFDNPILELREFHRLRDWLSGMNLTGILTATQDDTDRSSRSRYSNLQFLADCVLRLKHRQHEQVSLREMRVIKYRGAEFSDSTACFILGSQGFEVANVDSAGEPTSASLDRISSGIERLDTMLAGGYYRGSAVLITGLPGTAKTTLTCAFAAAACQRGENVLYVAFDESPAEIVRNLTSLGISLEPHIASGRLHLAGINNDIDSCEKQLTRIATMVEHLRPNCLVIDPITTLFRAGGNVPATRVARRIVSLTKQLGMTLLMTSIEETGIIELEARQMHITTIADTWVHLTCREAAGQRNRALSIIKSRGSAHSNEVCELILSRDGVTLADVYNTAFPDFMGSLRRISDTTGYRESRLLNHEREAKRWQVHLALDDTEARIRGLQIDIEKCRVDIEILNSAAHFVDQILKHENRLLQQQRCADF